MLSKSRLSKIPEDCLEKLLVPTDKAIEVIPQFKNSAITLTKILERFDNCFIPIPDESLYALVFEVNGKRVACYNVLGKVFDEWFYTIKHNSSEHRSDV